MTLQDLTGQIFGQYELRQLIGVGGMGAVYRGFQANLEREVAIKVLSTALASETGYVERFYREAKTAAALEHAHIVPVYDYGIQRDISYVVMRLLAGGTLAERVRFCLERERSLPAPGEVGELLRQVASALDYAHSQGVIHRDIKPSNIMFDNQGNAYLVDFGIAKLMEATSSLTGTGVAMGTPIYMPPEQWRSENLTPAADQYALAATVYGLLTGRAPYEASTPFGLMHKHLNEMPTPVHLRRPGLPESASAVLERALAKAPRDRFATVTAFAQTYASAIAGHEGKPTGFFTVKLPEAARQEGPPRTPSSPRPPTPSSGGAPRGTPPGAPPPSEPSLPAMPTGADKPIHRSPVVWALALGLIAALAVIGVLVLGQGGGGGADTPAPGDLTGTALAAAPTPTELPSVPALVTATPLPSKTPELTATPEPSATLTGTATATETVTATATATASFTSTLSPTVLPQAGLVVLSPTYMPSDTPVPTDTLTPSPTPSRTPRPAATPWPTRTPSRTPLPAATPWPTRTPTRTPRPAATPWPTRTPSRTPLPAATPWPTRTPTPTPRPAAYPAGAPNADWTPVVREFNGLPMVYVPAGCFVMGSTDPQIDAALEQCRADYGPCERDWFTDEKPRSEVCLDAFWIGQTEVTNAQYQACVQAGACSPLKDRRYAGNADHPVVSVDWFQARDYAAWVGGALPSEAQWEYAARGPQGLQYPWGEEFDGNLVNYCDANCANEWHHAAYNDGYAQTAPVGSFPAGASWVGALDLSGNVWEWTSTLYQEYPYRAGDGREDPASAGWGRVLRGGSWTDGRFNARAADRLWLQPSTTDFHYGFRIVMAESGPAPDSGAFETAPEPTGVMLRVWGQETPLRAAPVIGAAEIARLPAGIQLEILGRDVTANYFLVSYQGQQGWVWLSYVSVLGDLSAVPVIGAEPEQERVLALVGPRAVIIYSAPDLYAARIETVENVELPITGRTANGQWYRIEWQGREAWIVNSYYLRTQGDKSTIPVVEGKAEEEAAPTPRPAATPWPTRTPPPTLTAANTFLGVVLQTDFSGGLSEFYSEGQGWRIVSEGGEMMFCVTYSGGRYGDFPAAHFKVPNTLRDYLIQARVRFTSASGHLALMTRLNSSLFGYRHALQWGAEGAISQYYYPADSGLDAASISVRSGEWYTLRAEVEGDTIRTFLDERLITSSTDRTRSAGFAAVESGPNTEVCIDDLIVRSLNSSPEAMRAVQIAVVTGNANMRSGPGTNFPVVGNAAAGDRLYIMEWSAGRTWASVRNDRNRVHAWISADLIRVQ